MVPAHHPAREDFSILPRVSLALVPNAGESLMALQDTSFHPGNLVFSSPAPLMCLDGNPWRAADILSSPAATH